MPCYHPREAWYSAERNANGKRPLVFDATKGLSTHPVTLPCGGCLGCRLDKSREWSIRLLHERASHDLASFVTLTYSDQNLPHNGSLDLRHATLFLKRLRKLHAKHNDNKIRFYMCGEYGDLTHRPHYHAILFGVDFADKKKHSNNHQGDTIYRSDTLNNVWGLGHCTTGNVTKASCEYVARYTMKKINGKMAEEHYQGRKPEFATMSLKPGIGHDFYHKYKTNLLTRDFVTTKGKQAPVPKYYDRLTEKENPEKLRELKIKRIQRALRPENKAENTDERLAVRKIVKQAKINLHKRTFI